MEYNMLFLKTLYRFFGIEYLTKYFKKNIGGLISNTIWIIVFSSISALIGTIAFKYYPGLNIPISETINQLISGGFKQSFAVFIILAVAGIVSVSAIVTMMVVGGFLLYSVIMMILITIFLPKDLIKRYNKIKKEIKEGD